MFGIVAEGLGWGGVCVDITIACLGTSGGDFLLEGQEWPLQREVIFPQAEKAGGNFGCWQKTPSLNNWHCAGEEDSLVCGPAGWWTLLARELPFTTWAPWR